jgi:hypothetical protein
LALTASLLAHEENASMQEIHRQGGTTTLQLVLAWCLVGIPLALGVLETLIDAIKLFQ